jgi:hypothetical protein
MSGKNNPRIRYKIKASHKKIVAGVENEQLIETVAPQPKEAVN